MSPATPSPPSTSSQKLCVVAIVAASKSASARSSRARRCATTSGGAVGEQLDHGVVARGAGALERPLGADQPLAHAVAQLAGGHARERDQQQLVQRDAVGDVASRERRDRVRLAGPGARLEHRDALRQRAADVERVAHWLSTRSCCSQPAPQAQRVLAEPRRLAGRPPLVGAGQARRAGSRTAARGRRSARARRRDPPSGSDRTPTRARGFAAGRVGGRRAHGDRKRLAHPAVVEVDQDRELLAARRPRSAAAAERPRSARDGGRRRGRARS